MEKPPGRGRGGEGPLLKNFGPGGTTRGIWRPCIRKRVKERNMEINDHIIKRERKDIANGKLEVLSKKEWLAH